MIENILIQLAVDAAYNATIINNTWKSNINQVATIYGRIAYPPLLGTHILRNETHYMRIPTPDIPVKLTQTMRHVSLYTCFG